MHIEEIMGSQSFIFARKCSPKGQNKEYSAQIFTFLEDNFLTKAKRIFSTGKKCRESN